MLRGARFLATFDIEDWFHAENIKTVLGPVDDTRLAPRVEHNTDALLELLADTGPGLKCTFFVLGAVARRHPGLVRRIAEQGHEIASHTDRHRRLYDLAPAALAHDLATARDILEQVSGTRVWGVRAPAFTINDRVLDHLAEAGYWYDSSYFPFAHHDRYGRLTTPIDPDAAISEVRPGLLELTLSRLRIGSAAVPWAGGGYFRLLPYSVFRWGVRRRLRASSWFMFYFHPWELDTAEQPPPGLRPTLRFRAYVGRGRAKTRLRTLLHEFGSARIDDTLRSLGYRPPGEGAARATSTRGPQEVARHAAP